MKLPPRKPCRMGASQLTPFNPELEALIFEISADTGYPPAQVRAALDELEGAGLFDKVSLQLDVAAAADVLGQREGEPA